jgi:5-methylcytosine-specific restriction protein A
MKSAANERFTRFLLDAAAQSKRIGYPAVEMVRMLNSDGGYDTVSRLLGKSSVSTGFVELVTRRHPELTIEALVLESEWIQHFDDALLSRARKRLREINYSWTEWAAPDTQTQADAIIATQQVHVFGLSDALARVLAEYAEASKADFTKHPLANTIRKEIPALLTKAIGAKARGLLLKGSAGQGNWARGPWVALFNPIITQSAQTGYYVCLLFREDMEGLYLCLGQAMTEAKDSYKADAKTALVARAENFRAMLGDARLGFPIDSIDLAPSSSNNDSAFYEAGIICAKYYPAAKLPTDAALTLDVIEALRIYDALIVTETSLSQDDETTSDKAHAPLFEDPSRFRLHKRVERNSKLVEQVKKLKGSKCEACSMDFSRKYGEIGKGYIEAHHLKPVSTLEKMRTELNPAVDFAVLCANCHRMIHRTQHVGDVSAFRLNHLVDD